MRILWVSHFVPYPPKGGVFQRGYNLLSRVGAKHEVHLLALRHKSSTHPDADPVRAQVELERFCRSVRIVDISRYTKPWRLALSGIAAMATGQPLTVRLFDAPGVREAIATAAAEPFDVVHLDTISLAQFLPQVAPHPVVLTHLGPEALMIQRRIAFERRRTKRLFFEFEWRALERYERRMCPAVQANVTMSAADRDVLQKTAPAARFAVVPNGVDTEFFQPGPIPDSHTLIYAGRLDQYATLDAIEHFLDATWPLVHRRFPDVTLTIVGLNPPESLQRRAEADARMRLLGFVPDIRPHFRAAAVSICPMRDGGGTRLKVLDAMALGMPIVSTSMGCEGIDVVSEEHVLIADDPEAFAAQIGRLFTDASLRERLAASARRRIEEQYSWADLAERLTAVYRDAIAARPRG